MKVTQGKWEIINEAKFNVLEVRVPGYLIAQLPTASGLPENHNHATLIADAGNTYNECGLLPSELLKEKNRLFNTKGNLVNALKECQVFLGHIEGRVGEQAFNHIWDIVESAINNATKSETKLTTDKNNKP